MQKVAAFLFLVLALGLCHPVSLKAQEAKPDFIDLQITPAYSPEELHALIQKLGKRGILLRLEETGYCNGELRVLKGEIIGSDGNRFGFETKALRSMNIRLIAQTKSLGVQAIRLKNRWFKCRETDRDKSREAEEEEESFTPTVQEI